MVGLPRRKSYPSGVMNTGTGVGMHPDYFREQDAAAFRIGICISDSH